MSSKKITSEIEKIFPLKLVIVFLFFSATIIICGALFYKLQRNRIFKQYENELTSIASLKVSQIEQWRRERLSDAEVIKDDVPLIKYIKEYFKDENQSEIKIDLTKWMESMQKEYDFGGILFIDTTLKVRLSGSPYDTAAGAAIREELKHVLQNGTIVMTDLHRSNCTDYVHLDLLIPLIASKGKNQNPFGVMIIRIDPEKRLFPLIQSWPVPSKSSETLLLRKDGDSVLYLNELRFQKNTSLNLRLPVSDSTLLASLAVNGHKGICEGTDYRNIPVVGYVTDVPGTSWFMVVKTAKEEIRMPMIRYFIMLIIIILLLLIINASVLITMIWNQRVGAYRMQLLSEKSLRESHEKLIESEELFRMLFKNMLNGFAYCKMLYEDGQPSDYIHINVNEAFELLTGLKNVEGKKVSEVIPGIHKADPNLMEKYGRVVSTGKPEVFETYVESLKMWFSISVYSPKKEHFVVVFDEITPRKLAEEKLQETNEYLTNLINYSNAPIVVWNTSQEITRFNHAFEGLIGYSSEEVIGKNIDVIFNKNEIASLMTLTNSEADGKQWDTIEILFKRKDGQSRNVLWNSAQILDKSGKNVIATIAQGLDITSRKKLEQALRESEQMYRAIGESIDYGVWVCDPTGRNTYASESFLKMVGISQEQCSNFGWGEVLHPDDAERTIAAWKECVRTGNNWDIEHRFRGADGKWHHVLARGVPVRNEKHEITSWAGINLDITNLKSAEAALRESEDKFKYVFDHSVLGKSITLPSGELHVNQAFCDMLGYTRDELEKIKWQEISHPDDFEITMLRINSLLSGEKDSSRFVKRYFHKNGSVVWTDVGTSLRRDDQGNPLYFITAINNITDRIQAEEALQKVNDELEERVTQRTEQLMSANKELEAFSYSVSHDLRAPLRAINSFTSILVEEYESKLEDEGKRICEIISSSAAQMGMLIDDLLSFSRIGRSTLNPSGIDMHRVVRKVLTDMESRHDTEKVKIHVGRLKKGYGDSKLIEQVWSNLISNAIKYSSTVKKPEIYIGSRVTHDMITYHIKDNGVGFDMQYVHKLFGVFQRLHTEKEFEGNGVGLAIVQRIVLKHGGLAWGEAEVGKGATFYFSLPVNENHLQ